MLPLLIRLAHSETGASQEAGFRRSPVRIGRNHLNDLTIDDPFVSQWHGIVRFDEEAVRFLDVGSTNGTELGGERMESKEELVIEPEQSLQIGPLTITFARVALRDDQILSRRASSFSLGGTERASLGTTAGGTMVLREDDSGSLPLGGIMAPAALVGAATEAIETDAGEDGGKREGGGAPMPPTIRDAKKPKGAPHIEQARNIRNILERLGPLHEALSTAHAELEAAMFESIKEVRSGPEPMLVIKELERQLPLAFENPKVRERVGLPPPGADIDVESWLGRLVPAGKAANWGSPEDAMERAGALLEAFAAAYVNLRSGQRQVMAELSVEPGAEGSTLHVITDPRELLYHLLDASVSGTQRVDEVSRAFADIALHQLGMLNGSIDGARALLWKLSPHAIGAAAKGALAKTSAGFGDWFWPFTAVGNYYRFASAHQGLSQDKSMTGVLFGNAFAKAYYRVTGSR